ncbi:hypothetical protein OG206_18945 [Streptomyces sp. NBC_01341]|uniref:hypothetical protein n=1 Tax=Streptomyces sp. NBC_01341 TaxID=2903831 RepID=UPI002E0F2C99|nr:hypothetical protein OG206_18945 [Streptomyces sp. NBC_01341]
MVLKVFGSGFHLRRWGAMVISTAEGDLRHAGYSRPTAKETHVLGTMGPAMMIAIAVTFIAFTVVTLVTARWISARMR